MFLVKIMLRRITSQIGGSVKQNVIIYYVSLSLNIQFCNLSPSRRERSRGHFRIMYSTIRSYVGSTVMEKIWPKWAERKATDIIIRCLKCKNYGFCAFIQTPIEIEIDITVLKRITSFFFITIIIFYFKYMHRLILGSKEIGWK